MRDAVREVVGGVRQRASASDVMVVAAAMTCYAVFGLVPLLAIGTRVAAALLGEHEVIRTGAGVARFVPGPIHLDRGIVTFTHAAAGASWWGVLAALVPASLYAEGTVRSLERFSGAPERRSRSLRGRALTVVFVALVLAVVLTLVAAVRPLLFDPFGHGTGPRLLGILVAFNVLFFAAVTTLALIYRLFASTPIRVGPLLFAAGAAASWFAGQTLGYVAAVRVIDGFAHAYGGYDAAAAIAALAFLAYLLHLVVLLGYALALQLHEYPLPRLDG